MNGHAATPQEHEVYWTGKNIILCQGRIFLGSELKLLLTSASLVLLPTALFFAFTCSTLDRNLAIVFVGVGALTLICSVVALFTTAMCDPGIIPKLPKGRDPKHPEKILFMEVNELPDLCWDRVINDETIRHRYCVTCNVYKPPRASHCSVCDNCVKEFDHHCPWVGTCIGQRNYRFFCTFVFCVTIHCLFVFAACIAQLIIELDEDETDQESFALWRALKIAPVSVILVLYTFLLLWSLVGLSCFHCFLICKGKTTREQLKANDEGVTGGLANCHRTMCSTMEASDLPDFGVFFAQQKAQQNKLATAAVPPADVAMTSPTTNGNTASHSADLQTDAPTKPAAGSETELSTVSIEVANGSRAATPSDVVAAGVGGASPQQQLPSSTS